MKEVNIKKCTRLDGTIDVLQSCGANTEKKSQKDCTTDNLNKNSRPVEQLKCSDISEKQIDLETGLVLRDEQNLRLIMKKGRDKIDYNIVNRQKNCLLFRLGYYPHNCNFDKASEDFERFIRRVRKKYEAKFGKIHYFNVIDLHDDLTLHFHGILYAPDTQQRIWIDQHSLAEMWGQGTVWLSRAYKYTKFDYILPLPTNSNSRLAQHLKKKFKRYLLLAEHVKIPRSGGFVKPFYTQIATAEYEELKSVRQPDIRRKYSYNYGYGFAIYIKETFYHKEVSEQDELVQSEQSREEKK